jgi:hypothetical protein
LFIRSWMVSVRVPPMRTSRPSWALSCRVPGPMMTLRGEVPKSPAAGTENAPVLKKRSTEGSAAPTSPPS